MEKKRITAMNSLGQTQMFGIDEYDDHVAIGALLSRDLEHIDVPAELGGKPVTEIGEQAFALCGHMIELILPDTITEIGPLALRDCCGLKKVVFPRHLKRLPQGLFSFCHLRDPELILPEELEVIEEDAFYSAGVFDLRIPDSVREIGRGAFFWGPRPITRLPYDKGWHMTWPYGEEVICAGEKGRITDLQYLEGNCRLYEITVNGKTQMVFYPCDYLDGKIAFTEEENEKKLQYDIRRSWGTEEELASAYKIRDAWKKGMIGPQ